MTKLKIACSHLVESAWEMTGLRSFLEYRDFGVVAASDGRLGANRRPSSGGAS